MFIKLTNKHNQLSYVNTDNICSFSKHTFGVYTWVKFVGSEDEMAFQETPEQIVEFINEHK